MSEAKRLSPDELDAALDVVEWGERTKVEDAKAGIMGHIAALEAEIARLNPSGQVAEDEGMLHAELDVHEMPDEYRGFMLAALARLAAKAQGYEAAVADNAALVEIIGKLVNGDMMEGVTAAHRVLTGLEPHPGAALLERHRKEVAKARNEGLERAAKLILEAGGTNRTRLAEHLRALRKETA